MARLISFFLFFLFGPLAFAANQYKLDLIQDKSPVEFLAVGRPSAIKIKGTGAKANGSLLAKGQNLEGELTLDLNQFETGIAMRDRHMKEKYLETGKPENAKAILKITEAKLPADFFEKNQSVKAIPFKGKLKLHNVEKDIAGTLSLASKDSEKAEGSANFQVSLPDFGIAIPSFAGVTVAETVTVDAQCVAAVKKF